MKPRVISVRSLYPAALALALIAALLIDQTQHLRLPSSQLAMLLNRFGFSLTAGSDARKANNEATMQVLLRLLAWEKPGSEELIDTKMLHRIDDSRVLLALVPTGRRSSVLPLLADVFEHHIRQRLRCDPHHCFAGHRSRSPREPLRSPPHSTPDVNSP
jgi:hypothetical protein